MRETFFCTRDERGFSLIELIIVIAVMAILIGVMAPQLMKYMEKTNVSADTQLCDSVKKAIVIAANDPEVICANDNSKKMIDGIYDPSAGTNTTVCRLDTSNDPVWTECAFAKAVTDILGFNPFDSGVDQNQYFRSSPARSAGGLMTCCNEDHTDFAIFIQHSDSSGKKEDHEFFGSMDELEDSIVIYAK